MEFSFPGLFRSAERRLTAFELQLHGSSLPNTLQSAHLAISPGDYLRGIRLSLLLAIVAIAITGAFFTVSGFGIEIAGFSFTGPVPWILLGAVVVPSVYAIRIGYPAMIARGRRTRIELDLPYAVSYMQALSTALPPYEMIHRVYEEAGMFGEVAKEFGMIVRDVELFGDDLLTAMKNLQRITPSSSLRDFLNDLGIVFDSGGDLAGYLGAKTEYYRAQAKQELDMVLKTIEIMAEVYVSAFVAGPIALIIMITAQGMTSSQGMTWLLPLMYIAIPAGAIVMIWILSLMLPPENLEITRRELVEYDFGEGSASSGPDSANAGDRDFYRRINAQKRRNHLLHRLKNPFRTYVTSYRYSIGAAAMIAAGIAGLWYLGVFDPVFPHNVPESALVLVAIGAMAPVAVAYEGRRWYVRNVESHLPEFLRELADMKDIGITLHDAIHRIAGARLGVLSSELSVTSRDIEAGAHVNSALVRMEERIGLVSVKRAISLLVRASEITTNLRQIFIITITDIEHYLRLKRERANTTVMYVMIIYLSFGIYLYTAYQLNVPFLESFRGGNLNIDLSGNLTDMFRIGLILGFFSGIMAGQFSTNSILAGFKHSILLLAAAVAVFVFIL